MGKLFISTEKPNFSKSVYIRQYQENNHQAGSKFVLVGQREAKKKFFETFYHDPTYYHNANRVFENHINANFGRKREFSILSIYNK